MKQLIRSRIDTNFIACCIEYVRLNRSELRTQNDCRSASESNRMRFTRWLNVLVALSYTRTAFMCAVRCARTSRQNKTRLRLVYPASHKYGRQNENYARQRKRIERNRSSATQRQKRPIGPCSLLELAVVCIEYSFSIHRIHIRRTVYA